MNKISSQAKGFAKHVGAIDRIYKGDSLATRIERRVSALGVFEDLRPAFYGLEWAVSTGRTSAEFDAALMSISPAKFCQCAMDIAARGGSMVAVFDAWKAIVG